MPKTKEEQGLIKQLEIRLSEQCQKNNDQNNKTSNGYLTRILFRI